MLGTLLVILFELAVIGGIAYTLRYTVQFRSGLNEPEKLQRIWSRSQEIRFQPVYKSMIFSIGVAHGAPAVFSFVVSLAFALIGLPFGFFHQMEEILNLLVMFACACIGPMIYRASGGHRTLLNVIALLSFNMVMVYLLIYETVSDLSQTPRFQDNPAVLWMAYFLTPIFLTGLQIPFALWGAAKEFPETARIYSTNSVPDWVRLNKTIILAAAPLSITRFIVLGIHLTLGKETYLTHVSYLLADMMLYAVAGLVAVISVNRALLAEDFRWQWRSFLTPAIPLAGCDLVIMFVGLFISQKGHFMTRVFLILQHVTIYGAAGSLGAYVYLFLAERYAQDQIADLAPEVGDEIFDEADEDNHLDV